MGACSCKVINRPNGWHKARRLNSFERLQCSSSQFKLNSKSNVTFELSLIWYRTFCYNIKQRHADWKWGQQTTIIWVILSYVTQKPHGSTNLLYAQGQRSCKHLFRAEVLVKQTSWSMLWCFACSVLLPACHCCKTSMHWDCVSGAEAQCSSDDVIVALLATDVRIWLLCQARVPPGSSNLSTLAIWNGHAHAVEDGVAQAPVLL